MWVKGFLASSPTTPKNGLRSVCAIVGDFLDTIDLSSRQCGMQFTFILVIFLPYYDYDHFNGSTETKEVMTSPQIGLTEKKYSPIFIQEDTIASISVIPPPSWSIPHPVCQSYIVVSRASWLKVLEVLYYHMDSRHISFSCLWSLGQRNQQRLK